MEIAGYENYLIYSDGKVYNQKYKRYLKHLTDTPGYKYVNLYKDGEPKAFKIHRLVAIHYIPNPENKPEVDHRYRDRTDNRVENLRWVTPSENSQNTGMYKTNTSGHKNINYRKRDGYCYKKMFRGVVIHKYFKTLKEALCYKYIIILKIRAGLVQ